MNKLLRILSLLIIFYVDAKLPEITPRDVTFKAKEFMKAHASHKKLTPELMQRIIIHYLEILDPSKTYFIEPDVKEWESLSPETLEKTIQNYYKHDFSLFENMHEALVEAIIRRREIDKQVRVHKLPQNVKSNEFRKLKWAKSANELFIRISRIRSLQEEATEKLNSNLQERARLRLIKHQDKFEEQMNTSDTIEKERFILSNILKATAASLDSHSAYFTPGEAAQFMIDVQHRLLGIGVQLRDDLNGITITKIVEGGPAALNKEIQENDRIIAVDGEPVVGMTMIQMVELIRGAENTPVTLTIIREVTNEKEEKEEVKLDFTLIRRPVIIQERRFESKYEPYGAGIIGYLKLYSFYEDQDTSSTQDLKNAITEFKEKHELQGLILDLRYNSGGLLSQAVDTVGLFISKGIAVSIKDENSQVQHLRVTDEEMAWEGPLIVLVSRMSASASEIVAQTLQDYGRAIVVGDERTFGKGSFQTFTLSAAAPEHINPEGEFKITRGRYYTVSGKTPQLVGVAADVCIPGVFCESKIGEKYSKYPLENDEITPNFNDDLQDVPESKREKIRKQYAFNLQKKLTCYTDCLQILKNNSQHRIEVSLNYQNFLKEMKKDDEENDECEKFGMNDLQFEEALNVMKDLILLQKDLPLEKSRS